MNAKTHTVETTHANTFSGVLHRVTRISDGVVAVFSFWGDAQEWIDTGIDSRICVGA